MIQLETFLDICDRTGIIVGRCIKVLGPGKNRLASLGDVILISVQQIRFASRISAKKSTFAIGQIHRALFLRGKLNFSRMNGFFLKFFENCAIIVNKSNIPLSNRIYGPVLREFSLKFPSIGCLTRLNI